MNQRQLVDIMLESTLNVVGSSVSLTKSRRGSIRTCAVTPSTSMADLVVSSVTT